MRTIAIACLLLAIFAISKADFTNTVSAKLNDAHDGVVTVTCSEASTKALVAAWLGPNRKDIAATVINASVNSENPLNSSNGVLYGGSFSSNTQYTITVPVALLKNSGESYTLIAYCYNGTAFSAPSYTAWNQTDNNGQDFYLDVLYNVSNYSATDVNVTTLQKTQAQVIYDLYNQLVPSQVVDVNGNPAVKPTTRILASADTLVVRTYILRDYTVATDNTKTIIATIQGNQTLAGNLSEKINAKLAAGTVTAINFTSAYVPHPLITEAPFTTTNATVTVAFKSSVNGTWSLVGVQDGQYNAQYLSNLNVLAGTFDNGTAFPLKQSGNITGNNTNGAVVFSSLNSNTTYNFYLVVNDSTVPTHPISPIYSFSAKTNVTVTPPPPSNVTNYTATATATLGADNNVVLVVTCSNVSTDAYFYAQLGGHVITANPTLVSTCPGDTGFNFNFATNTICGSQNNGSGATSFTFNINATVQRNLGNKYTYLAFCKNSAGNSSSNFSASWTNKDNGGKNSKLSVIYNASLNPTQVGSNQSKALASLLPTIPADLFQPGSVSLSSGYARSLADANSTTLVTIVLRNYAVANDTTSTLVAALNITNLTSNLNAYYKAQNMTTLSTVLNVSIAVLENPASNLTLSKSGSNEIGFNLNSTVDGSYVVCGVNASTYNNSDRLNPDDVFNKHDENLVMFNITGNGSISAGKPVTVTLKGLKANSAYNFYAVVQDNLGEYSNIAKVYQKTSNSGNFGEKLVGFGLALVLVMIAVLFN